VPVSRLEPDDPAVNNLIVLAATELTTDADIAMLAECLHAALSEDCNEHEQPGPPHRRRHFRLHLTFGLVAAAQ
jgi:hypothetical protein